jgi:hypothetical protein
MEQRGRQEAFLTALHGRTVVLDGISGVIRYEPSRITHEPDAIGRDHPEYQWVREMVGDDWTTDLTQSRSILRRIANELGIDFPD